MPKPIILGAGLAGLTTALALAPTPVLVVSPRPLGKGCSSAWAQGGIAAALGTGDNPELHAADTIQVGNGLNNAAIVAQVTQDAAAIIGHLIRQGVAFDRDSQGALHLGLEAAHQQRRIVHAQDATGAAVMRALITSARAARHIEFIEDAVATDVITDHAATPVVRGVALRRAGGDRVTLAADNVVLASGGAAGLWRDTTNPLENWGSGLAMAARAGAMLGDLEFVQFHPTALAAGVAPMPLISEALRGEGAILIDETGARFTDELQARDRVARAIEAHRGKGHRVFLDARKLGRILDQCFPNIVASCRAWGIDPATAPIPVRAAAHYHMGGVVTDAQGRTTVAGLWACGEVARTGLHGANRLASNGLLEAASFGARVAAGIAAASPCRAAFDPPTPPAARKPEYPPQAASIGAIMADDVGVIRNRAGLQRAVSLLAPLAARSDRALVGLMIAQSALRRAESRGAHYRDDFPNALPDAVSSRYLLQDDADAA